jgi:thiol-disulfide isomerase/thioredoxin
MKVLFLSLSLAVITQVSSAQITDSVFTRLNFKPFLYTSLPEGGMLDSKGNAVKFINFIKTERPFKKKPTLFITWSNSYCPPCIKLIDSILSKNIQQRYNVVLVNRDVPSGEKTTNSDELFVKKITEAHPAYSLQALSLFDTRDIFSKIDQGSAPTILAMDDNLQVAALYIGYKVTTGQIEDMLRKIDVKAIVPGRTKYFGEDGGPSSMADAVSKYTVENMNGVYTLSWAGINAKEADYKLNFRKTAEGYFVYDNSSLHVPKVEDLYNEAEIVAGVRKILASVKTNTIEELKGVKAGDDMYQSKVTFRNFLSSIRDNKTSLVFYNNIRYPVLEQGRTGKREEFHLLAKALTNALSIKPKEEKVEYFGDLTNTYTINKDMYVILKENGKSVWFNVVVKKDSDGNLPGIPAKKGEGQISFRDNNLALLENIAFTTTYETIKRFMKENNYTFKEENGSEISLPNNRNLSIVSVEFKGTPGNSLMVVYDKKDKAFIGVSNEIAAINTVFCEAGLKDEKFTIKKEQAEGRTWYKSSYKYQVMTDKSKEKIHYLVLISSLHPDFIK